MNIIDAAKETHNGKTLRRKRHGIGNYDLKHGVAVSLTDSDITADDWEIYQEQSPMDKAWEEWKIKNPNSVGEFMEQYGLFKYTWYKAERHFTHQSK